MHAQRGGLVGRARVGTGLAQARPMPTPKPNTQKALGDIKGMGKALKGLVDEVRVQVHLGAMELQADTGPYLAEVSSASRAAMRDLARRGKALQMELKRIRKSHQCRS
jgi:hypothetical protein